MESKRSEYLDEETWIEGALDLLVSGSIDTVRIEPLAKKLGVTKGSFYWHFTDRAALLEALAHPSGPSVSMASSQDGLPTA